MALVSVSGACSRSGKTALAATLLRAAPPGTLALKFTTTDDVFERCPRGTSCVVCDIDVPYRIVGDEATLRMPGTDTDRLAAAGAARVLWCIARRGSAAPAWAAVRQRTAGAGLVVMEGSTVVSLAGPDLHLFVAHPFLDPGRWKPASSVLARSADVVIVNVPSREPRPPSVAVMEALGRCDVRVADVTRPLEEWAPDLAVRLAVLHHSSHPREAHA